MWYCIWNSQVCKLLCAIIWVALACDEVKFDVIAIPDATLDLFEDLDAEEGSDYSLLKDLVGCITCSASDCLSTEFIHFDDDVPTCMEYNAENWESEFFDELDNDRNASHDRGYGISKHDRGYANMAMGIGVLINKLSTVSIVSTKQTTIDDYFQT